MIGTSSARTFPLGAFASWEPQQGTGALALARGVITSLSTSGPGTPVVLGVDDVHLLDDLSTFVLHQIVQRRATKVILTVCDDEPVPPSIQEVWKSGQLDRLDLQPLA